MKNEYSREIVDRYWLDETTCVMVFDEMAYGSSGDVSRHVEAEIHTDEDNTVCIVVCYDDEYGDYIETVNAKEDGMSDDDYNYFRQQVTDYYRETKNE